MSDGFDDPRDPIQPLNYATPRRRTQWAVHWGLPALIALMILIAAASLVWHRTEPPSQFPGGPVQFKAK